MSTIRVKVTDQNFIFTESPNIYSGDVNTDHIHFTFDETWDGFTKTAVFYRDLETQYYQILTDDECVIPHEVLEEDGKIFIGVFGTKNDQVLTSEVLFYEIGKGVLTETLQPSDPTPDIWTQILSDYSEILTEVKGIRSDNATFKQEILDDQNAYQEQWRQEVAQSITDAQQATIACNDAISALQLEIFDMNGGDPTTQVSEDDIDANGGYPV